MRQREITCEKIKNMIENNVSKKLGITKTFLSYLNKDVIVDDYKFDKEVRKVVNKVKYLQSVFKIHDLEIIIRKLKPCIKELTDLEIIEPLTNAVPRELYVTLVNVYLRYRYSALPREYTKIEYVNSLNLCILITFNTKVVELLDRLKKSSFDFLSEVAIDRIGLDNYL